MQRSDVVGKDRIVGRCWVSAKQARLAMEQKTAALLRLGAGIGKLKVSFTGPLKDVDRKRDLTITSENGILASINKAQEELHASDKKGKVMNVISDSEWN